MLTIFRPLGACRATSSLAYWSKWNFVYYSTMVYAVSANGMIRKYLLIISIEYRKLELLQMCRLIKMKLVLKVVMINFDGWKLESSKCY